MELVGSYLNEVGQFLPAEQRSEILLELRDDILGEVEGEAESAGRAPDVEDEVTVLKRFGHPLKVASRYQPQKYVIGPDLYPAFVQTLKVVFAIVIFAQVLVALIVAQTNDWQVGPFQLLFGFLEMVVWAGAIVVAVFVGIEFSGERLNWYDNWQPRPLAAGSLGVIDRGDVITNLVTEGFFLLWWNDVVVLRNLLPVDDSVFVASLSSAWQPYYWYLFIVVGVMFVLHFYVLVRGVWQRPTLLAEITGNTAVLGIGVALLMNGPLVELSGDWEPAFIENIQRVVKMIIVVIGGFTLWDIWLAFRELRGTMLRVA